MLNKQQNSNTLKKELQRVGNKTKAKFLARYFKTAPGEYGAGDIFLGITVPVQRQIAKKYLQLDLQQIKNLLQNKIHEYRLTALMVLVDKYKTESVQGKKKIFLFYLKQTRWINNWDLVDLSSYSIIGDYLFNYEPRTALKSLQKLAHSKNIWERRIAILGTFYYIRCKQYAVPLKIAETLLNDKHDLIHKAVGWMLRELGKRSQQTEEKFLIKFYRKMPRTMLRYAIERFSEEKRLRYLGKTNH